MPDPVLLIDTSQLKPLRADSQHVQGKYMRGSVFMRQGPLTQQLWADRAIKTHVTGTDGEGWSSPSGNRLHTLFLTAEVRLRLHRFQWLSSVSDINNILHALQHLIQTVGCFSICGFLGKLHSCAFCTQAHFIWSIYYTRFATSDAQTSISFIFWIVSMVLMLSSDCGAQDCISFFYLPDFEDGNYSVARLSKAQGSLRYRKVISNYFLSTQIWSKLLSGICVPLMCVFVLVRNQQCNSDEDSVRRDSTWRTMQTNSNCVWTCPELPVWWANCQG